MFNGKEGATAKAWSAWDDEHIYYYVEVQDETPNPDGANEWSRDGGEFFFDWENGRAGVVANNGKPYWQMRIAAQPASDGVQWSGGVNGSSQGSGPNGKEFCEFVTAPLGGGDYRRGYIIEVAFRAPAGTTTLKEGGKI